MILPKSNESQKPPIRPKTSLPLSLAPISDGCPHRSIGMPQQRCVPHAIVWQGDNPYQAWPPHLAQSYPSLNEHTVGYGPVWKNGIPEHLRWMSGSGTMRHISCRVSEEGKERSPLRRFHPGMQETGRSVIQCFKCAPVVALLPFRNGEFP